MAVFSTELLEIVNNENGFVFYKLLIDDICHFDCFVEGLKRFPREMKSLYSIFAYMDMFSSRKIPESKFRNIKNANRKDVFEFKKDNIRVYVILQNPEVYVITGGFKKNQKNDVERIVRQVKNFKQ